MTSEFLEDTNLWVNKCQSWTCVPEMLSGLVSRLCAFFKQRRVSHLRAGFPPKDSRILAFASSPIVSVFLLSDARRRENVRVCPALIDAIWNYTNSGFERINIWLSRVKQNQAFDMNMSAKSKQFPKCGSMWIMSQLSEKIGRVNLWHSSF